MRCLKTKWMRHCATLLILLLAAPSNCTPEQVDSFCVLYTKVVVAKGDEQIKASLAVKKRLLVNEQLYHAVCPQAKA